MANGYLSGIMQFFQHEMNDEGKTHFDTVTMYISESSHINANPLANRLLFEWQMIVNKSTNDRTQIKQNPSYKLSLRHLHLLFRNSIQLYMSRRTHNLRILLLSLFSLSFSLLAICFGASSQRLYVWRSYHATHSVNT